VQFVDRERHEPIRLDDVYIVPRTGGATSGEGHVATHDFRQGSKRTGRGYIRVVRSKAHEQFKRTIPAFAAVLVTALPVAIVSVRDPEVARAPQVLGWWSMLAVFLAALIVAAAAYRSFATWLAAIAVQSITALVANWFVPAAIAGVALGGILLVVAAASLARLPRAIGIAWILVQSLGLFAIYANAWPMVIAVAAALAYTVMQIVVWSTWRLAALEEERRMALETVVRELRSTQAMLDATARSAERADVARELHDVVGHHLVALGLQLDAAMEADAPREHLATARRLVRLVLADVREVVADLRTSTAVDLGAALRELASDGPGPRVVVDVREGAPGMSPAMAGALVRCAQEAVTNARKHADASRIEIVLDADGLTIADDGRGVQRDSPGDGFGLSSMRERCAAIGCGFEIGPDPRGGTLVAIRFPSESAS
jgi:signal transduction histidine kinase